MYDFYFYNTDVNTLNQYEPEIIQALASALGITSGSITWYAVTEDDINTGVTFWIQNENGVEEQIATGSFLAAFEQALNDIDGFEYNSQLLGLGNVPFLFVCLLLLRILFGVIGNPPRKWWGRNFRFNAMHFWDLCNF